MKEFKVGDWVTINWHQEKEPYQIIDIWEGDSTDSVKSSSNPSSTVFFDTYADRLLKDCTQWKPKENEWCWFWDKEGVITIQQASSVNNTPKGCVRPYKYCEPFIGELPSWIED